MNIDEMQAGRKMDALVAEKVMRWTSVAFGHECNHGGIYSAWGPYTEPVGKPPDLNGTDMVPRYSTNIAAALQVMMQAPKGWSVGVRRTLTGDWIADYGTASGRADTPELAIGRAALKAMGETQ